MQSNLLILPALLLAAAAPAPAPRDAAPQPFSASAVTPFTGSWAGDGFTLRSAQKGYVVQGKCAGGKITSKVLPDASGAFTASGYYNRYSSGYRLSDIAPRDRAATFTGKIKGNTLALTMRVAGEPSARHFILKRGAAIRFPDCK